MRRDRRVTNPLFGKCRDLPWTVYNTDVSFMWQDDVGVLCFIEEAQDKSFPPSFRTNRYFLLAPGSSLYL